MPVVDPETVSRGSLALDPGAAAASMGTVTMEADGTVTRHAAPAAVTRALQASIEGSNKAGDAVARAVIGGDDRVQITNSKVYPQATVGLLLSYDQKGSVAYCTATLIGPYTVITAAHCVYDHDDGGWATKIVFLPGATDTKTIPWGAFDFASATVVNGFIDDYDGKNYASVLPWDLALVTLSADAGTQIASMGVEVDPGTDFHASMIGYPADKPDVTMWQDSCDIPAANFGDQIVWHTCDTYAGASGAALWEQDGASIYIRAVNVAEDNASVPMNERRNYAVRMIDPYFEWVRQNYK